MEFKDKLPVIRKARGLSQEGLAELIGISRQAVAKWELGQTYPDVDNLIRLSDVLKISIDGLVKAEDLNYFLAHQRENPIYHEDMIAFLLRAKRSTYAGKGTETDPSRPNSHDYRYEEGEYLYIDTYLGGGKFTGEEAVWYRGEPIWSMNYSGRVLEEDSLGGDLLGNKFSGDFLKEAMREVPRETPYRGPALYQKGDYTYHCKVAGSFEWYQGEEEIFWKNQKIYECVFHGGMVK